MQTDKHEANIHNMGCGSRQYDPTASKGSDDSEAEAETSQATSKPGYAVMGFLSKPSLKRGASHDKIRG